MLERLGNGESIKAAARALGVAPSTAKAHADQTRERAGATNLHHLVSIAWQRGWLVAKQLSVTAFVATLLGLAGGTAPGHSQQVAGSYMQNGPGRMPLPSIPMRPNSYARVRPTRRREEHV